MTGAASAGAPDHVTILMATRDGARWLPAQLESLDRQSHPAWSLDVSDDRSRDGTCAVVADFAARRPGRVRLREGPGAGFAANFLSLIQRAEPTTPFAAFCDQDDVWLTDRLSRAVRAIADGTSAGPALYCGATWISDAALAGRRRSRNGTWTPSFENALVQCIAGGNTMVFNRAALHLLQAAAPEALRATRGHGPASHDWWAYQMVAGAGGRVVVDAAPCLIYRQHGANLRGANRGLRARAVRARAVLRGEARAQMARNLAALGASAHRLTARNRRILTAYAGARARGALPAARAALRLGLRRQDGGETLALLAAVALGFV